jgi:hypothetical protein
VLAFDAGGGFAIRLTRGVDMSQRLSAPRSGFILQKFSLAAFAFPDVRAGMRESLRSGAMRFGRPGKLERFPAGTFLFGATRLCVTSRFAIRVF